MPVPGGIATLFFFFFIFACLCLPSDAYDPLDPTGNITIRWDIREWLEGADGYSVDISIFNNQLYRHIEKPGWRLSWEWQHDEVIWDARGAEAAEQGNCSKFHGNMPHCCLKKPTIIDLLPNARYNMQTANCCKGGVISSLAQDPSKAVASFHLSIGGSIPTDGDKKDPKQNATTFIGYMDPPTGFTLGVPGYTCDLPADAPVTKFPEDGGRRITQATFEVICTYSATLARSAPSCCVSLSSFYNDTIVGCPRCSCGCEDASSPIKCVRYGEQPVMLQLPHDDGIKAVEPVVVCTQHMCPIRVHWHVKLNYKEYWRVKMTVTNLNLVKNYSEWNLVVQHPNLQNLTRVFSFNYQPLGVYPRYNDSGVFFGIRTYNDMLLQSGEMGNVQTEMLLHKDPQHFTFRGGWAFPRRIYFNGEQCVMPPPDMYPRLPNAAVVRAPLFGSSLWILFCLFLFLA